jgi:hypothetical protein
VAAESLVERAMESLLRRDETSIVQLEHTVDRLRRRGRRGPAVLDRILDRRPSGTPATESDPETIFLQAVRHPLHPDPVRQRPIVVGGTTVHRIDFVYDWPWLPAEVWVEVDGVLTHEGAAALTNDLHRQNRLMRSRPVLLRFTSPDVYRRPAYLRQEVWHHLGLRSS